MTLESGRPRRFEYRRGTSAKFWQVEVPPGSTTMITVFGRIGTEGQSYTKRFRTYREALNEAEKKIAEKLNKGYGETLWTPRARDMQRPQPASRAEPPAYDNRAVAMTTGTFEAEVVYEGALSDEQIVDLASKLAKGKKPNRTPPPASPEGYKRCTCGNLLVSPGENSAGRCAACLSLQINLMGSGEAKDDPKGKRAPEPLEPVRKIRFTT